MPLMESDKIKSDKIKAVVHVLSLLMKFFGEILGNVQPYDVQKEKTKSLSKPLTLLLCTMTHAIPAHQKVA